MHRPSTLSIALGLVMVLAVCARSADVPAGDTLDKRIAGLIQALGDSHYSVRERAQQELAKLGFEAFDALSEAQSSDDPEIAAQASYLVRLIRVDWTKEGDPRPVQQILKDYETQSYERRLARIRQLADLPDDLGLEWLCRLARFEKSPLLSKHAAIEIIDEPAELHPEAYAHRQEIIKKAIERGHRSSAGWLAAYLLVRDNPQAALAAWDGVIADERKTLEHHPKETNSEIVIELLRKKVALLDRLSQPEKVPAVIGEIVMAQRGDPNSLIDLIEWLQQRQSWDALDLVASRFASIFDADAVAMYSLCTARKAQGQSALAEELAAKAIKLGGDSPFEHRQIAERLLERGLTDWSDREFRVVIQLGPIASPTAHDARFVLSESLHDRQRDKEAAEVWRDLIEAMESDTSVLQQESELLQTRREEATDKLRAKMHFYLACDAARRSDEAAERELLDKAFAENPEDVEVLIAAYQRFRNDPQKLPAIKKAISESLEEYRQRMDDTADVEGVAVNCNQFAWLVANTEGHIDEAIRLSQKSIELARTMADSTAGTRRVGGFLDTLAHCYYAKKDYAAAVKHQVDAVRLDPHAQAIARELVVFKRALAEQNGSR